MVKVGPQSTFKLLLLLIPSATGSHPLKLCQTKLWFIELWLVSSSPYSSYSPSTTAALLCTVASTPWKVTRGHKPVVRVDYAALGLSGRSLFEWGGCSVFVVKSGRLMKQNNILFITRRPDVAHLSGTHRVSLIAELPVEFVCFCYTSSNQQAGNPSRYPG